MENEIEKKPRIINCHTHIFTGDYVPPLLGRTLIPLYLYYLLPLTLFVKIVRWWYKNKFSPYRWRFQTWHKKISRNLYILRMNMKRFFILRGIKIVLALIILFSIFHDIYQPILRPLLVKQHVSVGAADRFDAFLIEYGILIITDSLLLKLLLLILFLLLFSSGINLLFFFLRKSSRFFRMLPGKQTAELFKRYMNIIRYARYANQSDIMTKLTNQYPPDSAMVVLPMDMEFMGAGKPTKLYEKQMEELAIIKKNRPNKIFPFVFVDPRRKMAGGKVFFDYDIKGQKVILKDCFIKDYIETKGFSGFKIYPALGYFPFDEVLLPLWKYAADNGIPIMTHCIRGVVYYRGDKEKIWDYHPVFQQAMGKEKDESDDDEKPVDNYEPLLLSQMKAVDVQEIFTHPLNYLCLLKKGFLAPLIEKAKDPRLKVLFGYHEDTKVIDRGLGHLKICFGHFGGDDEWAKHFEKDRDNYADQIVKFPDRGIDFSGQGDELKRGKVEQIWKSVDWYTIICSLMIQHDHVYADISYILHGDRQIISLLKHTMQHHTLKLRVLYGSDFYVVRNHKSDKNMLADMESSLNAAEFDQIARVNPVAYLAKGTVTEKPS